MRGCQAIRTGFRVALFAGLAAAASGTPTDDAISFYRQKRFSQARAALEHILESDPSNARACYYLGLALQRGPAPALDAARAWLDKASKLAPQNEAYLAEYAGVTLLIADRDNSLVDALEGRNAMTRAVSMNSGDIEAIDGLMQFYAKAPWPLGDTDKAMSLAADIAKQDGPKGAAAYRKISEILEKQGHPVQALAAAEAAQKLAPPPQR